MGDDEVRDSTQKRRRVAVACDECRRRKIRCDGLRPLCTFCLGHGLTCAYHKGPQRVQVSRDYLDSLVRQAQRLERAELSEADQLAGESPGGCQGDECVDRYDTAAAAAAGPPSSPRPVLSRVNVSFELEEAGMPAESFTPPEATIGIRAGAAARDAGMAVFEDSRSVTDTIVCSGSPPPAVGGNYFGASSTPAFLEAVQSVASRNSARRSVTSLRPDTQRRAAAGANKAAAVMTVKSRFLPPRGTSDHLVETYFSHVCITFSVLHEQTFREEYEHIWQQGAPPPGSLWLSILNSVLALGALFSDRLAADEGESTAEAFFSQGKELCDYTDADEGCLAMVQALLLMGHYLHIKRASRCWHIFGLAIRTAQGLGLHLSDINNKYDPVKRETRKRCWCGCLIMDTMVSMTFGRPTMIPPEDYQGAALPAPVDDAPKILLFICRVELCIILHSILRQLYEAPKRGEEATFRVGDMARLDDQLTGWLERLPPSMRLSSGSVPAHMLYTRYLTVRILLTRPSLVAVARASSNPHLLPGGLRTLDHSFALSAAGACVETSKRLVDHIHTDPGLQRRVVGAAWYNTNCVFNAALVIFVAHIIPALRAYVSDGTHWQECLYLMRSLSHNCRSAQACLSVLDLLDNRLTQHGAGHAEDEGTEQEDLDSEPLDLSALPDWTGSLGFDELLLGREFGALHDVAHSFGK